MVNRKDYESFERFDVAFKMDELEHLLRHLANKINTYGTVNMEQDDLNIMVKERFAVDFSAACAQARDEIVHAIQHFAINADLYMGTSLA